MKQDHTAIGIVLLLVVATAAPLRVQADGGATIAVATIQLLGVVIGAFGSETDPNTTAALQNRELLMELGERFSAFGHALGVAIDKISGLPEVIRKDMEDAFDEFQRSRILGLIDLVMQDTAASARGSALTVDPIYRAHDLQREVRTLMNRSDLNAPIVLTALGYELALLAALGASDVELETARGSYVKRFLQALDSDRAGSLAHNYLTLKSKTERDISALGMESKLGLYERRSGYLIDKCRGAGGGTQCLVGYHHAVGSCERNWGQRLSGEGYYVREELEDLERQIIKANGALGNIGRKATLLVAWREILTAVRGALPDGLATERHARALSEEASPGPISRRVGMQMRKLAKTRRTIDAAQRAHLTEVHRFSFVATGLCL